MNKLIKMIMRMRLMMFKMMVMMKINMLISDQSTYDQIQSNHCHHDLMINTDREMNKINLQVETARL